MDCHLCQKELDAYIAGQLSADTKTQVEKHLAECNYCKGYYQSTLIINSAILKEKTIVSNPFLSTRVMASIETPEPVRVSALRRILKPVLLTVSFALTIYGGIMIGRFSNSGPTIQKIPIELALMDDSSIESLVILSNE